MKKVFGSVFFITGITSLLIFPQFSYAYYTNGGAFFNSLPTTSDIATIRHWTDSSVATYGFTSYFTNARARWDEVANASIGWSQQSTASNSFMRFYGVNDSTVDYTGKMKAYDFVGTYLENPDNYTSTWYAVNVLMNSAVITANSYTSDQKQKVAIHEIGHGLGLRHQPKDEGPLDTVMMQGPYYFTSPGSIDKTNVAWRY